jgi:hypothetical protein
MPREPEKLSPQSFQLSPIQPSAISPFQPKLSAISTIQSKPLKTPRHFNCSALFRQFFFTLYLAPVSAVPTNIADQLQKLFDPFASPGR